MGARMQAFVMTGVGDGSIRELDRFEPAPADVVVRTLADAVCTIERRIFSGDIAIAFPVIGGHEVSGTVVEAMDNGCGLEVGDRVVLDVAGPAGAARMRCSSPRVPGARAKQRCGWWGRPDG